VLVFLHAHPLVFRRDPLFLEGLRRGNKLNLHDCLCGKGLIPDCEDTDSFAAPSALEHGAHIPLDHRTFLQWTSRWGSMQRESGSASFGISERPSSLCNSVRSSPAIDDFAFTVNIVAVVRVRAADESVARKVVATVLGAPGTVEVRLANEGNAVAFKGAIVTDVEFLVEEGSINLVESSDAAIMADFTFKVNLVAVVRVRAGDESVARKVVPTVLIPPGTVEIRLANENNAATGHHATITGVDFSIGSVEPFEKSG
jgi:hypothetical protein